MTPFEFFTTVVCQRLTWALLHFLWQGFAIAAAMALLLWRLRVLAQNAAMSSVWRGCY